MYGDKLKDPRWQKVRLQIFERDDFTCRLCGDKETTLHVHHLKYFGEPWEADKDFLKTVCEDCHQLIEDRKKGNFPELKKVIKKYMDKADAMVFFFATTDQDLIEIYSYTEGSIDNFLLIRTESLKNIIEDLVKSRNL